MAELVAKELCPPGVHYYYGDANGAQVISGFDLYDTSFTVLPGQLPAAESVITVLRATGMDSQTAGQVLGIDKFVINTRLRKVLDVLNSPMPKRRASLVPAIARLCLPGSLLAPTELPDPTRLSVDNGCLGILTSLGHGKAWGEIAKCADHSLPISAKSYVAVRYAPKEVMQADDRAVLLLHAFGAGYLDPAEVVAGQMTPPPTLPLPRLKSSLLARLYQTEQ